MLNHNGHIPVDLHIKQIQNMYNNIRNKDYEFKSINIIKCHWFIRKMSKSSVEQRYEQKTIFLIFGSSNQQEIIFFNCVLFKKKKTLKTYGEN